MASKAVLVCSGKGDTRGKFELHEPRLIEVTLAFDRKINKRLAPLVRFLNARAFVCHVRPNFEEYYLKEVTGKTYSSCRKVFMEEVRQHA